MQNRTLRQGRGQARSRTQITCSGAVRAATQAKGLPRLSAVLRAAVPRWLTTLCDQWQTQMRLQCPAERQALADGNPLRVIADPSLEAQPRSAGSR
jgi:hypothetical protein